MNNSLPHNDQAEQSILSSCLLGGYSEPCALLDPEDFYNKANSVIFKTIKSLNTTSKSIDLISVVDAIQKQGQISTVGGASYVSELLNNTPASTSIQHHCKIIKEKSVKRKTIQQCNKVMQLCYQDADLSEIEPQASGIGKFQSSCVVDKQRVVDISNVYTADRMLESYTQYIDTLKNNKFLTGIGEIDKRIRGIAGGETLFIIARAGAYKTALLQNLLRNYINASSWGSVFFSIEMPVANITERYLQQFDKSDGHHIEQIYKNRHEFDAARILESRFKNQLNRFFVVPTKVSLDAIEKYVKLIENHHKIKIGVIGIDYMQLIEESGSEYEAISKIARGSKDLAKYLNIPVVVLSQINRQGEDGTSEVTLNMGRGSGAIEEAADFMLGLWKSDDNLICKILKNRKGPAGSRWQLELDKSCFWIGNNATAWTPPKKQSNSGLE